VLVVMRHAKAEQYAASDHERPLEARGRRDAEAAGSWLARHEIDVDYALVSSAMRAVETWEALADAAAYEIEPDIESSLFAAGPDTALDVLRGLPDEAEAVLVIGHNPTVASLVQLLDDGEGDDEAIDEMTRGFPAAALCVFEYNGEWADLEHGTARVTGFNAPQD